MKWIVIGIAGPTCSGKTTLATKLNENIKDSILISQDAYFLDDTDPRHTLIPELNHFNWEILSSLDMPKMHSDILKIVKPATDNDSIGINEKSKFLIIEGFLIFNYKPVADLCDYKFFIEISKEKCWYRREKRVYEPPDKPGYFEKIVWPEYLKYKNELNSNVNLYKSIKFLDGNESINQLFDKLKSEISEYM